MPARAYAEHMADFANNLPLSNRPREDESQVTSDRRVALAGVIEEAARVLAAVSIDDEARAALAEEFLRQARLEHDAGLSPGLGSVSRLTELAAAIRSGRRRNVRALSHAVRSLLVMARQVGAEPDLPALTSGAVALYAATAAPLERRAVVAGHTIRATDVDWAFGRGPTLQGRALEIVSFLLGLSEIPPHPRGPSPG